MQNSKHVLTVPISQKKHDSGLWRHQPSVTQLNTEQNVLSKITHKNTHTQLYMYNHETVVHKQAHIALHTQQETAIKRSDLTVARRNRRQSDVWFTTLWIQRANKLWFQATVKCQTKDYGMKWLHIAVHCLNLNNRENINPAVKPETVRVAQQTHDHNVCLDNTDQLEHSNMTKCINIQQIA